MVVWAAQELIPNHCLSVFYGRKCCLFIYSYVYLKAILELGKNRGFRFSISFFFSKMSGLEFVSLMFSDCCTLIKSMQRQRSSFLLPPFKTAIHNFPTTHSNLLTLRFYQQTELTSNAESGLNKLVTRSSLTYSF